MAFEYFIGKRYLRSKRKEAFVSLITGLSIFGVAVGVMVLIIVIGVMTGFESELKKKILGIEPHVMIMHYSGALKDTSELNKTIKSYDTVATASPFFFHPVIIRSHEGTSSAMFRGVEPESMACRLKTSDKRCLGDALGDHGPVSENGLTPIVMGKGLAEKLSVGVGDVVHLILARNSEDGKEHLPSLIRLTITGLFEVGMLEYDGNVIFTSLVNAQKAFQMTDKVTGIGLRLKDVYAARSLSEKLMGEIEFPYYVRDWMRMNKNLFSMLKLQKTVMFIILILIVVVAAFNIASALIMMVMEKTKDIAILKTMGAKKRSILKVFVINGMFIGLTGTAIGTFMGVFLSILLKRYQFIKLAGDVYFLSTLPVKMDLLDMVIIVFSTLFICFISTLYPALRAAKFNPVEGIRYG